MPAPTFPEFVPPVPNQYVADARYAAVMTGVPQALAVGGVTQALAAPVVATTSLVSGANGTAAVVLSLDKPGRGFGLVNQSASILIVFPPVGGSINGGTVNAGFSLPA